MNPSELGNKYDKICKIYENDLKDSAYGIKQIQKAISYTKNKNSAFDVSCGVGDRVINLLEKEFKNITGLDVSSSMLELAKQTHKNINFINEDICRFETKNKYDFIVAWDSLFHLPLDEQKSVLEKLCKLLETDGILIYTFGDDEGEHTSIWHDNEFYYSSIGINKNIQILINSGLKILHMELDQYPERHVYIIAKKS